MRPSAQGGNFESGANESGIASLPAGIDKRLAYWHGLWTRSAAYHYLFGVVSVAASVISTSMDGQTAKTFSTIAAIATAMIGFMHPERRYMKFVRAWRVLDVACLRYQHGLIDRAGLIDALERGESLIAEFEDKYDASLDEAKAKVAREVEAAQAESALADPSTSPLESTASLTTSPSTSPTPSPPISPPALTPTSPSTMPMSDKP